MLFVGSRFPSNFFVLSVMFFALFIGNISSAKSGKKNVNGVMKIKTVKFLDQVLILHKAMIKKNEEAIVDATEKLIGIISKNNNDLSDSEKRKNKHLVYLMSQAREDLVLSLEVSPKKRKQYQYEAFKNISQVVLSYNFSKYRVYFCPEGKSYWVQKKGKMRNPFGKTNYSKCLWAS